MFKKSLHVLNPSALLCDLTQRTIGEAVNSAVGEAKRPPRALVAATARPPIPTVGIEARNARVRSAIDQGMTGAEGRNGGHLAEFRKVYKMQGFDREAAPRWQMVPMTESRFVVLRDGAGLTVTSASTSVATVAEIARKDLPGGDFNEAFRMSDRFFKLDAAGWGTTKLQAKPAVGPPTVGLEVDTKNLKKVRVMFNFVKDNAGHKTGRVPASAMQWVIDLNRFIFKAQANVEIVSHGAPRWVTVPQNLGDVVRFSAHLPTVAAAQHEWGVVVAQGNAAADVNVFLVWEYEQDDTPYADNAGGGTSGGNTLLEDHMRGYFHRNLGHELGHALGLPDHYNNAHKHDLMYGYEDGGTNLPKAHANIINP